MSAPPNWLIGFPVSDAWVGDALVGVPDSLRTFGGEDIHFTIAFLGGCGETNARLAWRAFHAERAAHPPVGPLTVTLDRIALFGRKGAESYLSAVPAGPPGPLTHFIETHRNVARAAAGLGEETRPVSPHVTIARTQRPSRQPLLQDAISWATNKPALGVQITLDELALYTWTPKRHEQLYYIVERCPFGQT